MFEYRLGVQQRIDVLPWIQVENYEAGSGTQGQLPEQKAAIRIDSDVARLDHELKFRHNGQAPIDNKDVEGNVLRGHIAA